MSFGSALSGLNAASADLNVTGNNIANSQTIGFKFSRAEFADIFATSHLGVAHNAIGQGVKLTNVAKQFTQGQFEYTGNVLDLGVAGEGFFRMEYNGALSYTRAGNFQIDKDGFIVNPTGHRLTGFQTTPNGNLTTALGPLRIDTTAGAPKATESIRINANLYAFEEGLDPAGFDHTNPDTYSFSSTGTVYDSQGRAHMHTIYFVKHEAPAENTWDVYTNLDGHPTVAGPFTVEFNNSGVLVAVNGAAPAPVNFTYAAAGTNPLAGTDDLNIALDLGGLTQFGASSAVNELAQDGYAAGQFSSLNIEPNGVLFARYTNGQTKVLGQIALVRFAAQQNLTAVGDNAWKESYNSGEPIIGAPETGQFGKVQAGALEQSNVNVSEQLVRMIVAQRSYQANAKMISTQDQITQELMNIRR